MAKQQKNDAAPKGSGRAAKAPKVAEGRQEDDSASFVLPDGICFPQSKVRSEHTRNWFRFVNFLALDRADRAPDEKTQLMFGKKYKVDEDTLTRWKGLDETRKAVAVMMRDVMSFYQTPRVLRALLAKAVASGDHKRAELWLKYAAGFIPKSAVETPPSDDGDELDDAHASQFGAALANLGLATLQAETVRRTKEFQDAKEAEGQ